MPTSNWKNNIEVIVKGHCVSKSGEEKDIINRYIYVNDDTPFLPSLANFDTAFKANFLAAYAALLNSGLLGDTISYRQLDDATNVPLFTTNTLIGGVGSNATMVGPQYTAYLKLVTTKRGRNYRGSKHYSPLDESMINQGELDTGGITAIQAMLAAALLILTVDGHDWIPAVMSQNLSQVAVNPVWVIATRLTSLSKSNKTTGVQRHRKFKTLVN